MKTMYLYEIKKILFRRRAVISLIILLIYLIGMTCFQISEASWITEDGREITGIEAIKLTKEAKEKWNGVLTEEVIKSVINENRSIIVNPEYKNELGLSNVGYAKTQGFSDIKDLINNSFGKFGTLNYYLINSLSEGSSEEFYDNRILGLKDYLDINKDRYADSEKEYFLNSFSKFNMPMSYSYMDGWINVLDFVSTIFYAVIIIICVLLASTFSEEYQYETDAIFLSTYHGKRSGIIMKIFASMTVATVLYWGVIIVFSCILFSFFGISGANNAIQSNGYFWESIYNVTNIQAFWIITGFGYVGCLIMSSFTLFLSANIKTSFLSIVIVFLVIMIPAVLGDTVKVPLVNNILKFLPHQMLQGKNILRSYNVFTINSNVLNPYQFLSIMYVTLSSILLPLAYKGFKTHNIL